MIQPHTDYLWRVEFPDGSGPYAQRPSGDWVTDSAPFGEYRDNPQNRKRHPMPWADGIDIHPLDRMLGVETRKFAFDTLEQGQGWFYEPRDGDYFAAQGLTLAAYPQAEVSRLELGRKQAVFDPAGTTPIRFDIRCLWSEREDTLSRRADEQRARARN